MELGSSRRSQVTAVVAIITVLYWAVIFAGTHWPTDPVPPTGKTWIDRLDKSEHLVAFGGLAVLLCAAGTLRGASAGRLAWSVPAIVALYGAFDELTQAFVRNRQTDIFDWLFDMLGASAGVALFLFGRGLFASRAGRMKHQPDA
jgi:VanZ family protein